MNTSVLGLSIVELIFYVVNFPISIFLCHRHGWARTSGWIFLFFFIWIRVMSSASTIAATVMPNDTAAFIVSTVLSSTGTTTILLTQLGILKRLQHPSQCRRQTQPQLFLLLVLALLAMLGVAIASGVFLFSTDPSRQMIGHSLSKATGGLALGILGLLIWCVIATTLYFSYSQSTDSILLYATWAAFPFFTTRVIYIALVTFQTNPSIFSYVDGNILAAAFMSSVPEFVAVLIYTIGGIYAPAGKRIRDENSQHKEVHGNIESISASEKPSYRVSQREH